MPSVMLVGMIASWFSFSTEPGALATLVTGIELLLQIQ